MHYSLLEGNSDDCEYEKRGTVTRYYEFHVSCIQRITSVSKTHDTYIPPHEIHRRDSLLISYGTSKTIVLFESTSRYKISKLNQLISGKKSVQAAVDSEQR